MEGMNSFLYLVVLTWDDGSMTYFTVRDYGNIRAINQAKRYAEQQEWTGTIVKNRAERLHLPDATSPVIHVFTDLA